MTIRIVITGMGCISPLGRNVQYYDKPAVRELVRAAQAEDYTFAALVRGIVKSVPFRMRQAPPIEG